MKRGLLILTLLALARCGAQTSFGNPDIVPTAMFSVPEGLEVTIWARSPLVRNPTNMDIDAKGRIWITQGVNYRKNIGRDRDGDQVVVLEDTDADGRADKSTVFVQEPGLIAPLGIAVIDNQVVVSNAPDLIVYTVKNPDRRYDPRMDRREVLLTGFNGRNSDHSLHSVTFGPDGRWYFNHGNSGAVFTDRSGRTFRIGGSTGGTRDFGWKPSDIAGARSDDGHVYVGGFTVRMNSDGTGADVIGYNYRNCYEQCVTSFGDVFQSDNDDPPACRTSFVLECGNAGYYSRDGKRTWQADIRPGQDTPTAEWRQDDPGVMPAGDIYGTGGPSGIVNYEGDLLGEKWRGLLISADSVLNSLLGYLPRAEGAGYKLERMIFLTTNREQRLGGIDTQRTPSELNTWFRPSDVAVGPDGAIYVADWFDPRTGGHVDLDTTTSGTIYRIAPKGFQAGVPHLDLTTTEGQIAALKSPAVNVRASGFMRLKEKRDKVVRPVAALLSDHNPFVRARAVWLLAQLGQKGVTVAEAQLNSNDPLLRIAALRALRRVNHDFLKHAYKLVADQSPAVRREVALGLRNVPIAESQELLLKLARGYDGIDRTYLEAWGIGCTGKENEISAALSADQAEKDSTLWSRAYARLQWRLTAVASARDFARRAGADGLSMDDRVEAITALGFMPSRAAADALLEIAQNSPNSALREQALWWLLNYRDSRWTEFNVSAELKQRGLYDPDSIVLSEVTVPAPQAAMRLKADAIAGLAGDPERGASVARQCMLCHRIGKDGIDYGPDLTGFAHRQTTNVLVGAILNPSSDISLGFDGTEIVLKDGMVIHGRQLSSGDPIVIQSTGGLRQTIPKDKIRARRSLGRSLMLSADQLHLTAQDVADIVAYLKSLN